MVNEPRAATRRLVTPKFARTSAGRSRPPAGRTAQLPGFDVELEDADPGDLHPDTFAALSAASTRASRKGTRRRRTPVASKIALPMAASVGLQTVSLAP